MTKKAKKKARSKQDERPDDGTAVYDEDDDDEDWVEDEQTASMTAPNDPAALVGTNQELNPDAPVYGPPEDTVDLPEPDRSEAPLRPEDQEPEPYGSDISPNQAFNVKAGSMPEDRPDHDKPIGEKGKDPAYGYDVIEDVPPKGKRREK